MVRPAAAFRAALCAAMGRTGGQIDLQKTSDPLGIVKLIAMAKIPKSIRDQGPVRKKLAQNKKDNCSQQRTFHPADSSNDNNENDEGSPVIDTESGIRADSKLLQGDQRSNATVAPAVQR